MRKIALLTVLLLGLLMTAASVGAITWGTPDGDGHPYVGLLVFDINGSPSHRCSGTLLSPTVVLTAGHCTFGTSGARVWFDSDVSAGRPDNGYPFGCGTVGTCVEAASIHTHPQYDDNAFYLHDVGIVILSEPVNLGTASLASVGLLDELSTRRGLQEQTFTPVGYGVQEIVPNPNEQSALLIRYRATTRLISTHGTAGIPAGTSVLFTNNPGQPATGGTCFGDSGGPIFHGDSSTVVAVTSFGINSNCVGNGGGYRIDTADDQAFIGQFLG